MRALGLKERRQSPRHRTFAGAVITFPKGDRACTIVNVNRSGALLRIDTTIGISASFELVFADGRTFQCKVVHRSAEALGVVFDKPWSALPANWTRPGLQSTGTFKTSAPVRSTFGRRQASPLARR